MLGIKCGQVFLDADHYGFWLSTTSFTMAFCCVISEITSQSPCSWGRFGLKFELCWKWRRIFLVDQRQISWCVFFNRHISHQLAFDYFQPRQHQWFLFLFAAALRFTSDLSLCRCQQFNKRITLLLWWNFNGVGYLRLTVDGNHCYDMLGCK